MNNKQRWVVVLGFIVILVLGLFPPWLLSEVFPGNQRSVYEFCFELRTVFAPRLVKCGYFDQHWRVDTSLLLVEWFLVSAVTGIIVVFLGDHPQRPALGPGPEALRRPLAGGQAEGGGESSW